MRTKTIAYLKENPNTAFVIQSIEDIEYGQESLALMKLLTLSEKSLNVKKISLEEAFG